MSSVSSLLGAYEASQEDTTTTDSSSSDLDKDDFLTLLVAQLTNQDPLNPMEDTDMTSQLAEFSSLEQLTNLNETAESILDTISDKQLVDSSSFIGQWIYAEGYTITKEDSEISTINYSLGEAVANVTVYIYDSEGDIIRTDVLGSKEADDYTYQWDGKDDDGNTMDDGLYSVGILGEDADGEGVLVQTQVSGEVVGVTSVSGTQYLQLADGRYVSLDNVYQIVAPGEVEDSSSDTTADSSSTSDN